MTTLVLEHLQHADSASPDITIDSSGRIGIGTTSPGSQLTVQGTLGDGSSEAYIDGWSIIGNRYQGNTMTKLNWAGGGARIQGFNSGVQKFEVSANSSTYFIGGDIGIGTSTPLRKLHIADAGDTHIMLQSTNAADNSEIFEIGAGANSASKVDLTFRTRLNSGSGGTEHMRITNDGYVTTPNQPGFRAYSTIGNISSGAIVQYNIQDWGNGSHYSTGANRFTAPVSGKYAIHFSVKGISIGAAYARIKKNGTHYGPALEFDNDIASAHTCMSFIGSMNVNDYIEVWAGSNVKVDSADSFSVILIG